MTKDAWTRYSDEGYRHYQVVEAGYKYNMTDIKAAIGIHQLARVEENWKKRERIWGLYMDALGDLPLGLPAPVSPDTRHAYHLFTVLIEEDRAGIGRDEFLQSMTNQHIGVGVHYLSIPEHPYYQQTYGWRTADFPEAARVGRATVSLPLSAALSEDDVYDVVEAVHRVVRP